MPSARYKHDSRASIVRQTVAAHEQHRLFAHEYCLGEEDIRLLLATLL